MLMDYLEGMPEKKHFLFINSKRKQMVLVKRYYNIVGKNALLSDQTKIAINTGGGFGIKRSMALTK